MHIQDNRYDASYNFIQYSDKGPWSVRFTAWYVAGLLHRNQGDDVKHAEASIRNMYVNCICVQREGEQKRRLTMRQQTGLSNDRRLQRSMVRNIQTIS
jgi:hypothetical protein